MSIFNNVMKAFRGAAKPAAPEKVKFNDEFNTKEEVISFVRKEFEERQKSRRPKELQWVLNQNFLNGNQYCDINLNMQEIQQITRSYDWEEREVFNQIAPIYETRLAKLKSTKPVPFTIPATQESNDINTAKTTTSVLKGINKDQNMTEKRAMAIAWCEICGCAFYKRTWNLKGGRLIGEFEGEKVYEGAEQIDVVSPFEIFPDSNFANGIEGLKSIIHARAYPAKEIMDKWPKDVEGNDVQLKGRNVNIFTLSQTNIGLGGLGYESTITNFISTVVEKHDVVYEMSILPDSKHPEGLIIIATDDYLLHYGPYIYNVGDEMKPGLNYTMQVCIETPGYFWPASVIERLIPIQRRYNAVKNKKQEILNRVAIGILAVQDTGNVDTEDLEEEGMYPGKILTYGPGESPPKFLEYKNSTTDFDNEERRLEEQFAMISGVSPFASQSLPPTGVISGTAMEQLRESDDSRISLTADNIKSAAIKGWKVDIRMNKQFALGPRLLRYVGENNDVELVDWQASDLTSDDIVIDNVDELSQTPSERIQIVKELLQYRLFSSDVEPKVRNKVISMMKLGNWESTDDIEELHLGKAKRENKFIREGKPPFIKEYDMHELHVQEHNRFRLDVSYEEFEISNPEFAAIFDQHVQQHQAYLAEQTKAIASQMQSDDSPDRTIPYDKLPIIGKIQMAEQAGIELKPEDIIEQTQLEMAIKNKDRVNMQKAI